MRSMTGFGAATGTVAAGKVTAEVRSVNHRFLDVRVVLPREYGAWEGEIRDLVRGMIDRGRVELFVTRTTRGSTKGRRIDIRQDLARAYVRALRRLKAEMKLGGEVGVEVLTAIPDLVRVSEVAGDPTHESAGVRRVVRQALNALGRDRRREGGFLAKDMRARVRMLEQLVANLERALPGVLRGLRDRAARRLRHLAAGVEIDPQRLAQEAAVLAERADVTEEIVRIRSHLPAMKTLLGASGPVGKRIEFLLQELQREINTVGAKVGDARVGALVLDAKAVLEKLREQVQNVE